MMRQANEIDFWRGFALVSIFINHIPDNVFDRFTHRNLGLSDSAELFVFLAGWSLRRLVDSQTRQTPTPQLMLRLSGRALRLHSAQILITTLALAMLAAAALYFDTPPLLEWHNAASFFNAAAPTVIGIVLLTHQLGYFDILPLYVVLMHCAPLVAITRRLCPLLLLPVSVAIYLGALIFNWNMPSWPVEGRWYFNPLSWQLIFVLGFELADENSAIGTWVNQHAFRLRWLASFGVMLGALAVFMHIWPDPTRVPWPPLFFVFNKTYLSPARLLHFLSLAMLFAGLFGILHQWIRPLTRYLSMLGRNSLIVFCMLSLLSLAGQLVHYRFGLGLIVDVFIVGLGLTWLGFTAWVSELRERLQPRS
jgi:hypothetical protein